MMMMMMMMDGDDDDDVQSRFHFCRAVMKHAGNILYFQGTSPANISPNHLLGSR